MRERKTDRVYGQVWRTIRKVARRGKPFTISAVRHNKNGARRALAKLVEKGELKRVKQGRGASNKSVYQIAT